MNFEYRDAIVTGDQWIIKKMIAELRPKFFIVLKKYGANEMECQEYFQITLKIVVEYCILDKDKQIPNNKFSNYFTTIGLNKWRTYCKQKKREISTADLPDTKFEPTILEDMMRKEEHRNFMRRFEELGKNCQRLLWKKIVEEQSYADIASEVGKSEKYLRVHLNRCKKYLIKLLQNDNTLHSK